MESKSSFSIRCCGDARDNKGVPDCIMCFDKIFLNHLNSLEHSKFPFCAYVKKSVKGFNTNPTLSTKTCRLLNWQTRTVDNVCGASVVSSIAV